MSDFHGLYPFGSPLFGGLVKDTISSRTAALADILCAEYLDQIARVQIVFTFMVSAIVLKTVAVDSRIVVLELGDNRTLPVLVGWSLRLSGCRRSRRPKQTRREQEHDSGPDKGPADN